MVFCNTVGSKGLPLYMCVCVCACVCVCVCVCIRGRERELGRKGGREEKSFRVEKIKSKFF